MQEKVILDALHLYGILSNASGMLASATVENKSKTIDALEGAPEWLRSDNIERMDIAIKHREELQRQGTTIEDLKSIVQQIKISFQTRNTELFNEIISKQGKTIAIVLALYRAMWENQKKSWKHIEENRKHGMPISRLDMEIAIIDKLASDLGLRLPSL